MICLPTENHNSKWLGLVEREESKQTLASMWKLSAVHVHVHVRARTGLLEGEAISTAHCFYYVTTQQIKVSTNIANSVLQLLTLVLTVNKQYQYSLFKLIKIL